MEKECEVCGVSFNAQKSRIKTCSRKCGGIRRSRKRPAVMVARVCPGCGVEYKANAVRLSHGRETTCSRVCSYKVRADKKRAERESFRCATCGEEVERLVSEPESKHGSVFCSRACHYAGRRLGLVRPPGQKNRQTREGVIAQRKAGAETYARGDSIQWPQIERDIATALRGAGHVVIQQHIVSDGEHFWPVDLFVPALLTVIEIDGEFHRGRATAARDAMVDATCARQGLRVVRVPDGAPSDVRKAVFRALAG